MEPVVQKRFDSVYSVLVKSFAMIKWWKSEYKEDKFIGIHS